MLAYETAGVPTYGNLGIEDEDLHAPPGLD
jgi:hypothetical protein